MHWERQKSDVEIFLKRGWFITNNAEQIANIIMELKDRDIKIKAGDPGDYKYYIEIA
jgi:hypothetical protein